MPHIEGHEDSQNTLHRRLLRFPTSITLKVVLILNVVHLKVMRIPSVLHIKVI